MTKMHQVKKIEACIRIVKLADAAIISIEHDRITAAMYLRAARSLSRTATLQLWQNRIDIKKM